MAKGPTNVVIHEVDLEPRVGDTEIPNPNPNHQRHFGRSTKHWRISLLGCPVIDSHVPCKYAVRAVKTTAWILDRIFRVDHALVSGVAVKNEGYNALVEANHISLAVVICQCSIRLVWARIIGGMVTVLVECLEVLFRSLCIAVPGDSQSKDKFSSSWMSLSTLPLRYTMIW